MNTYTTNFQENAGVAADSAGNFVVDLVEQLAGRFQADVFGQRYASNGTPLGPEFRVNTYTTNGQGDPAVAGLPPAELRRRVES